MLTQQWVEWIGYIASALVVLSLWMSSIVKLRFVNLSGALFFIAYGLLIQSFPVVLTNFTIACINIYYLFHIQKTNERFTAIEVHQEDFHFEHFIRFYYSEILKFFPKFQLESHKGDLSFYIYRNLTPAGIFIARKITPHTLHIDIDFVTPAYRDFKVGHYIYSGDHEIFTNYGIHTLQTYALNEKHEKYLLRMGFIPSMENAQKLYTRSVSYPITDIHKNSDASDTT